MDQKGDSGSKGRQWIRREAVDPRGGSGSEEKQWIQREAYSLTPGTEKYFLNPEGDFAIPATPCSGTEGHHHVFPIYPRAIIQKTPLGTPMPKVS